MEDFIDCGWAAWTSVQPTNDIEKLIETYGDQIGFVGGYDTTGPASRANATDEAIAAEVGRCIETYG